MLQEEVGLPGANESQKQVLYDLKSENDWVKDNEIELREEAAMREANLRGPQSELEFRIKQLEWKESELREEGTSMPANAPQRQILNGLKSENERLKGKETNLREEFAIQEANMRSMQNEVASEINRFKHREAEISDELAAKVFEHRRIQDELEIEIKSLGYRESELREELAVQVFHNQDHLEINKLQNELTSTRAANDSQIRNLQNEVGKLRARGTRFQNELISIRAAKESEKRDLQDELETAQGRERELRKQSTSKEVTDSSEIQDLWNKPEELRHAEEVGRLKEMVRYRNTSLALSQQVVDESLSRSKESHAGTKSLRQELSAEQESKHMLEEDIVHSLSKQNGLPPINLSPAIQFVTIIPLTEKGPERYDNAFDPAHQTVQLNPYSATASIGVHLEPTYNPGIPTQVSHPDRSVEQNYELQTGEIQNAPPLEGRSADKLLGPPPISSLIPYPTQFLYPTSSQEMSYQSYGTEKLVPQAPNATPGSGYPFPLSSPSSTNSLYYVPRPQIPTVGSRGIEGK